VKAISKKATVNVILINYYVLVIRLIGISEQETKHLSQLN